MARRVFDMFDLVEVLQHWYAGRSKTDVGESLGIDRGRSASTSRRPKRPG
jgi:hypothetical protein